jgi:hypothetical protein
MAAGAVKDMRNEFRVPLETGSAKQKRHPCGCLFVFETN